MLLKEKLRVLIKTNRADEALNQLYELLKDIPEHKREFRGIINLSHGWHDIKERNMQNSLSDDDVVLRMGRIVIALIEILEDLPVDLFANAPNAIIEVKPKAKDKNVPNESAKGNGQKEETLINPFEDPFSGQMILVKGGELVIGDLEKPIHRVRVSSFNLSKYVVIREQWEKIMGVNLYKPDYPIGNVSWLEVQEFIEKLNQKTGKFYRLPTEFEWEFAARGGKKAKGRHEFAGSAILKSVGWFKGNANEVQPPEKRDPNELGFYDMSGNIWEWCADFWHESFKGAPINTKKPWNDGGDEGLRVIKGGSFKETAPHCRIGARRPAKIKQSANDIGFRLACDV